MALVLPEKGLSETEKSRGNWPGWRGLLETGHSTQGAQSMQGSLRRRA